MQDSPKVQKILLFCRTYFGRSGGIYAVQVYVQVMLSLGYKVTVITRECEAGIEPNLLAADAEIIFENDFFDRHVFLFLKPFRFLKMLTATHRVLILANREKPDLIMVQGERPYPIYLKLKRLAKVVFCRHDGILACPSNTRFLPKSRSVCTKAVGLSCLKVDFQEGCLADLSWLNKIGRIVLRRIDLQRIKRFDYFLANSYYLSKIHQADAVIQHPPLHSEPQPIAEFHRKNPFQLLFVGRFIPVKGVEEVIKILESLPRQYTLTLVGDGPLMPSLRHYCQTQQLEDRVEFTGWLSFEAVYEKMQLSGVTIVPSLWDETFGLVGIESFGCGTPVVAYDVGGITEWCHPPYGITVPCGAYERAAQAVLKLTGDLATWQDLCYQCTAHARDKFSKRKFEVQLKQFLEIAIASHD